MLLRELVLVNFRNYVRLALAPGERVTVLRGNNGQGKSNILEAIYFLATTRSPRAGSDRELVHWRARRDTIPFARLEARIAKQELDLHLEILIRGENDPDAGAGLGSRPGAGQNGAVPASPPVAKQIKVNGLPTRAVDLVGQVNVVLFTPDDIALVAGPPVGRRRYLDSTNSQVSGTYLRTWQRYNHVLVQRNHLLRQVRERRQARDQLDFWNAELVTAGSFVVARRFETIAAINRELGPIFRQLSGTEQTLEVVYHPTSYPAPAAAAPHDGAAAGAGGDRPVPADLADRYADRVRELLPREIDQGVSLVGPHRDDLSFVVDGVDLNTYGSRGQQRLAVLALKLAEGQFMRVQTAERPILLLDDVLSELDPTRRGFVLDQAGREGQTIITTTDLGDFPPAFLGEAVVFRVEHGAVLRQDDRAGEAAAPDAGVRPSSARVPPALRRVAEERPAERAGPGPQEGGQRRA
jgi:DNA replication and repair protein RecF